MIGRNLMGPQVLGVEQVTKKGRAKERMMTRSLPRAATERRGKVQILRQGYEETCIQIQTQTAHPYPKTDTSRTIHIVIISPQDIIMLFHFFSSSPFFPFSILLIMGISSQQSERHHFWSSLQQDQEMTIFKRGELVKQSKHLKQWRNRTVLLIHSHIVTLQPDCTPPTAVIPLTHMQSLSCDDTPPAFYLKITTQQGEEYRFRSPSQEERDAWFTEIKAEKVRMLKESKVHSSLREEQSPYRVTFLQQDEEEGEEAFM